MKTINNIFSKTKMMNLFLMLGIIFITNQSFASNGAVSTVHVSKNHQKSVSDLNKNLDENWKVLLETKEISIYYIEVKDNPCMGYKLKIVNHTDIIKIISFGIATKLADNCRDEYKTFNEFQFRKITVNPNETIVGSENTRVLLVPITTLPMKDVIQNLSAQ